MKKKYLFGPIILALVLFASLVFVPASWLAKLVPADRLEQSATSLEPNMFQGTYLQGEMLADPEYVPIYGSSELSRWDPFHPSNYFAVNGAEHTPYLIGKGGTTSIIHDLNFATHADKLKGKRWSSSSRLNGSSSTVPMNSISHRIIPPCRHISCHSIKRWMNR